mmetsp:Transcript_27992/g.67949  ORF Transcript_27992/g.67949 Transcript_27992/m.67949 type:complete len:299 (-) Transcript_27992:4437-5333(-)
MSPPATTPSKEKENDVNKRPVVDAKKDGGAGADGEHEEHLSESPAKRIKTTTEQQQETKKPKEEDKTFDTAVVIGYKAGDELEVQWELEVDVEDEETGDVKVKNVTKWWKATLLPYDTKNGKVVDNVAVRTLRYEAMPEFGFEEESEEDVMFLSFNTLVTPPDLKAGETIHLDELTKLTYRRAGREDIDYDPESVNAALGGNDSVAPDEQGTDPNKAVVKLGKGEEAIDALVDSILDASLKKLQSQFVSMPASQQAMVGSKIAQKKEKLKQALLEKWKANPAAVLSADDTKEVLASLR